MASSLPPISLASSIIGFISFAVTLLTLIRVTWDNLEALIEAPSEIKYAFANLKSALHEERAHVRQAANLACQPLPQPQARSKRPSSHRQHRRRRSNPSQAQTHADSDSDQTEHPFKSPTQQYHPHHEHISNCLNQAANWRVLQDSVRRLCREFREVERPFLSDATLAHRFQQRQQRNRTVNRGSTTSAANGGNEKWDGLKYDDSDAGGSEDEEFYIHVANGAGGRGPEHDLERGGTAGAHRFAIDEYVRDYAELTLVHRLLWLRKKSKVGSIAQRLQQVQIRRASAEITQALRYECFSFFPAFSSIKSGF
jgi:hypothetical protein